MKIRIDVTGFGNEVVMGNITPEVSDRIWDYMEENDLEELEEFYNEDGYDEIELYKDWHENDDLVHSYGPNEESTITITDEAGVELYTNDMEDLKGDTEGYNTVPEEFNPEKGNLLFFGWAREKGDWYAEFDIPDGEKFDITKLGIRERVLSGIGEFATVFDKLTYNGEEIGDLDLDYSETKYRYMVLEPVD